MLRLGESSCRSGILAVTVVGLAAAVSSCGRDASDLTAGKVLANTGEPAMHGMQSERLRELMGDLGRLSQQGGYASALKLEERQEESLRVAAALEESVAKLRNIVDDLQLTEAERETFLKMVAKQEKHTKQFREACRSRDLAGMRAAMNLMTITCNACHSTFRKMAP